MLICNCVQLLRRVFLTVSGVVVVYAGLTTG